FVSDGGGGVGADVAEADVRICPVFEEPIEEKLWRAFVRLFGRRRLIREAERLTIPFRHRWLPWVLGGRNRKQVYLPGRCPNLSSRRRARHRRRISRLRRAQRFGALWRPRYANGSELFGLEEYRSTLMELE